METPPYDPHETQPIPVQPLPEPAAPAAAGGYLPAPGTPVPGSTPARYVHPFGNVGVYLLGRFGAFLIDMVLVTFVLASFGLQLSTGGNLAFGGHDQASFTLLALAAFGAASLLLVVSEGVFGTSLGKLVFALHVRRSNGNWAGPGRALLRMLLRPFDILIIGPILALITPRHQRVGDFFAGTVVGRSRIGWLSTLLGLAILALVGYAQILYGGGVTTALTFAAEGATYLPQFYRAASQPFAATPTTSPLPLPTVVPQGSTPAPDETPAPALTEPAQSSTEAPSDAPSADATPPPAVETG